MTKFTYYYVKNAMLFSSFISNFVGVVVVLFLTQRSASQVSPDILRLTHDINLVFLPASFILPLALILLYERPVRAYLKRYFAKQPLSDEIILKARQKLLNEPFFLIGLALSIWLAAAVVFPVMFWVHGAGREAIRSAFFRGFYTGLTTITVAFFVLEFVLQRGVVPYFFPNGGLSLTPRTLRIRIRTRLIALLLASNIIPLVSILQDTWGIDYTNESPANVIAQLQSALFSHVFVFIAVGVWLTFLVSSNLTQPLEEITHVLRKIKNGLFETKVRVTSNDEIGYTGDVINEMAEGLIERDRIKHSLALAKEIQQSLIPKETLKIEGFDVAGKSLYCDETGGDYYDFIDFDGGGEQRFGVAIGDVAGHGVSSALLMAAVRSSLRQRASHPGSPAQIISDVNRQLAKDVEHSGEFVTLFFLVIDTVKKELEWVRAGHDPALIYDPARDAFTEMGGAGMALGVDEKWRYGEHRTTAISKGQVILLGTDGVWEAANLKGEMFGKEPVYDAIRKNHTGSADEILEAILSTLNEFQGGAKKEDDVTLVIIKMQD
ncbi:MAG: SpoIIE family protein phosphatase [Desulfobacterales bacterium]|nr:MAG: SpoIIE family protein phosphatase [Desulfobacterales bacterium]